MIKLKAGVRTSALKVRDRISRTRKNNGLRFQHYFSREDVSPFDDIEWERRTAEITDDSGKTTFRQEDVEVPKSWSALATKIAVSKYFYGDIANGTDPRTGGRESSIRQLVHRVTRTIADWGVKDGYFADHRSAEAFYSDLSWLA
jgi:ribonucleoside-diphosphate reductase alpha chain